MTGSEREMEDDAGFTTEMTVFFFSTTAGVLGYREPTAWCRGVTMSTGLLYPEGVVLMAVT